MYEVSFIIYDNYHYHATQIYLLSDLDDFIYVLCIMGVLSAGNLFPQVTELEKLKMSQQPVSKGLPLNLPAPIVMMFFLF